MCLGTYASAVAKMLPSPIFHVNGEYPQAVARVVELAMDFRNEFHRDVIVDISDRGPGIPAAERERVVKPFERLERSRSHTTGGSGLGLAIVQAVVAGHGGAFTLVDRAGGGLTARIGLAAAT